MFAVLIDQFWSLTIAGVALGLIYGIFTEGAHRSCAQCRGDGLRSQTIHSW